MKWFALLSVLLLVSCKKDIKEKTASPPSSPIPNMEKYGYTDGQQLPFNYSETIKKDDYGNTVSLGIYGKRFKELASGQGLNTTINSTRIGFDSTLASNILGTCSMAFNTIYINPSFWFNPNNSNVKREFVLFHELGHCVLNRLHNTDKLYTQDTGTLIEKSIMTPYIFSNSQYERNHNYYTGELLDENYNTINPVSNGPSQFGQYYPLPLLNNSLNKTIEPLLGNSIDRCGTYE